MKLNTYTAETMAEALRKVKKHLGRDAVIVSTRTVSKGGFLGFGGRRQVEITAARQLADLPAPLRPGSQRIASPPAPSRSPAGPAVGTATATMHAPADNRGDTILTEVGQLKSLMEGLMRETRRIRQPELPDALLDSYTKLVENDVAEELARGMVDRARSELSGQDLAQPDVVRAHLAAQLESMLPEAGPIQVSAPSGPTLIALVGPTGVGKTTTVAKLAANLSLRERRSVGLITIDTYRIGAVEQLRTYAQIIDVPLEVVMTPVQLREAVERMSDRDVVLIDTAGRGQRDAAKLSELEAFFTAVPPHETHLVLSMTSRESILRETVERFRPLGFNRLILTKLDEAIGFGVVLSCLEKLNGALSYVTTGQDVPDDIEVCRRARLAEWILEAPPDGLKRFAGPPKDDAGRRGAPGRARAE